MSGRRAAAGSRGGSGAPGALGPAAAAASSESAAGGGPRFDALPLLRSVALASARGGGAAFLVGGAVRDALLGRATRDVDVAIEGEGGALARILEALASTPGLVTRARHARFGTATFESPSGLRLDVAATRRESYPRPAALPVVETGVGIQEDLARRDFTVHAMARRLGSEGEEGDLLDPHAGARDLAARTLRLLHDLSLVDDPTRIFRAARYAARLGFAVAPEFAAQLETCRAANALRDLSADRLRRALGEVLAEDAAAEGIALLRAWGVLRDVVPALRDAGEGPFAGPIEERWAALAAPLAPESRRAMAERLNFSRALRRAAGVPR